MRGVGECERHVGLRRLSTPFILRTIIAAKYWDIARFPLASVGRVFDCAGRVSAVGYAIICACRSSTIYSLGLPRIYGDQEGCRVDPLPSQPKRLLEEISCVEYIPSFSSLTVISRRRCSSQPRNIQRSPSSLYQSLPSPSVEAGEILYPSYKGYSDPCAPRTYAHTYLQPPIRPRTHTGNVMFDAHTLSCRL
jgi:hypothetical protein